MRTILLALVAAGLLAGCTADQNVPGGRSEFVWQTTDPNTGLVHSLKWTSNGKLIAAQSIGIDPKTGMLQVVGLNSDAVAIAPEQGLTQRTLFNDWTITGANILAAGVAIGRGGTPNMAYPNGAVDASTIVNTPAFQAALAAAVKQATTQPAK